MNRHIIGLGAFLSAIAIGAFTVGTWWAESTSVEVHPPVPTTATVAETVSAAPVEEEFAPEFRDLPSYIGLEYPELPDNFIDLHNTDGLLRTSETVAKNGESWLVMYERNGKYETRRSKARVTQLRSVSYPGDENDAQITFRGKGRPVFAFRDIENIGAGPVTTVYLNPTWKEIRDRNLPIDAMELRYAGDEDVTRQWKRDLNLNENWSTLYVSAGLTTDDEKVGVLVLENNGVKQVVSRNYFDPEYGTIIGNLLWAGDIDGDGKLDLYFDDFNEKGAFVGGLYLSSHAEDGELIKLVGVFGYAGC